MDDTKIGPAIVFGGLIGATWISAGAGSVHFGKIVEKVLIPAAASPVIAGLVAMAATYLVYRFLVRGRPATRGFKVGQIVSASLVSLAHGTNDAQKTMGVITLTLVTAGSLPAGSSPPVWVIISAACALALGTYLGGWRITHTLGKGLTDIEGPQGFAAQTSSALVILVSSRLGFPLSTTHVCSGGIVGSGVGRRDAPVRWRMAGRMVVAWLFTLPAAAIVGAISGKVASLGSAGTVAVGVVGIGVGLGIYLLSRRHPVTAHSFQVPEPTPAVTEPGRLAA